MAMARTWMSWIAGVGLSLAHAPAWADERCQDRDGDGYGLDCARGQDCNDKDASMHPGAAELRNFRDDDCNGLVDELPGLEAPPLDPSAVSVPAGPFVMGSELGAKDEQPVHTVQLQGFRLDRHEVTNRRYRACVTSGGCTPPAFAVSHRRPHYFDEPSFDDYPVILVSWQQATQFCRVAGGRLPTEAEWEKSARGSMDRREYPWGNEAPDCARANLGGASSCVNDTDRVGRRPSGASPYGALDLAGNVWEWVSDWYQPEYYAQSPAANPTGPSTGTLKVMRGGCWDSGASSLRVSCRKAELPAAWADNVGFRCAYPEGGER